MWKPKTNLRQSAPSDVDTTSVFFERMEPRILFSADALAGLVATDPFADNDSANAGMNIGASASFLMELYTQEESSNDSQAPTDAERASQFDALRVAFDTADTTSEPTDSLDSLGTLLDGAESGAETRQEIIFVDAATPDYQQLLAGLNTDTSATDYQIFILQSDRDGIEQITEVLGGLDAIDAIHLVSHGNETGLQLGNNWLNQDSLSDSSELLGTWSSVLEKVADILIYGCNLAAGDSGLRPIDRLADLTGADVAASDDLTGATELGGDWDLEYRVGDIESKVAVSEPMQQKWFAVLAPPVFQNGGPFNVDEGATATTIVGNVDGDDGDGGAVDAGITYSITTNVNPDGDGVDAFAIDSSSGEITVNDAGDLDFEGASSLVITVEADDGSETSSTNVTIDINDVAPKLSALGADVIKLGQAYMLDLTAAEPGTSGITSYTVNWGDGTITTEAYTDRTTEVSHIYTDAGFTYNITFAANDVSDTWTSSDLIVGNWIPGGEDVFIFDGETGSADGVFDSTGGVVDRPYAPVVGPDGNFYVSGYNSDNIAKFAADGSYLGLFSSHPQLNNPSGLAWGSDGNLYVANYGGDNILRFQADGTFIDEWGVGGTLNGPTGLAFGPVGDLYASSWDNNLLVKIDGASGGAATTVIGAGLNRPEQIVFDGAGDLFIANAGNNEVSRWNGAVLTSYFTHVDLSFATGLTFGPDGDLYVSSYSNDKILRYDGVTGTVFADDGPGGLRDPEYLTFTPDQQVTVVGNYAPTISVPSEVFINELHYDNLNVDTGEAIEVMGPAGTDLTGWSLALYSSGNGNIVYDTVALSGTIADQSNGYGTAVVTFPSDGIQNGVSDGIALVNPKGQVIQFISYEGTLTAADGPAVGLTSVDIGVSETNTTPAGYSLQLTGTGSEMTWMTESANTFGALNTGQNIFAFDNGLEDTDNVYTHAQMLALLGASDVDDIDANLTIDITNVVNGTLVMAGGTGGLGTVFTFTPAPEFSGQLTFDYQVFDDDAAGSAIGNGIINIAAVNDAPSATNLSSTSAYNEGDPSVAITDIVVTDVDAGEIITATLTLADTSTGSLSANDGATYDGLTGIWTITDTMANINTALANLVFNPIVTNTLDTSITVSIDDGDEDASGPLSGTITLDATPVSNGIDVTTPATDSTLEDTDLVFSVANGNEITVADGTIDDPLLRTTLTVTNGTLTLATTAGLTSVTGDGTDTVILIGSESDINTALDGLTYAPTNSYSGPADLTVTTDLQADLLGYYEFEINGDIGNDTSPNGTNDGAVAGATQIIDGTRGNVLHLDGNDVITIPGTFGDPQNLTLAAWVQLDATSGQSEVISLGDRVILRLDMTFSGLGVFGSFYDGSNYLTTSSGTFISGTGWHHVAYTLDGTANEQTLYIDGVAVDTTNHAPPVVYAGGNSTLGSHPTNPSYFLEGEMDDARIYDRALSAGAIQALANDQFSDTEIISITVNPVNDAPTATNLNSTSNYNEGDATVPITDIVVSDLDTGDIITATLTLTDTATGSLSANDGATYTAGTGIWTITDTVANVNTALANLVFNPTVNNEVDTSISVNIDDGDEDLSGALTGTIDLDVTPVNDAPTATGGSQGWLYNEGVAVLNLVDIVVSDVDSGEIITATLTLADTGTGSLSANDGATYTPGTGVWTITDTLPNVNTALANLVFNPNTDNDINTTINVHIEDAAGAGPADSTIDLDVTPFNDAPTATNMTQVLPYNEGDAVVAVNDIVVTEVDTVDTITATLTLANTSTGALSANDGASYNGGTGIWTITDTVTNVNTALANVVFNPNPANDVDTTITTHIEDAAGTGPVDGSITLDVTPINDAPTATNLSSTSTYNEGDASVAITDIVVSDIDTGDTITATLTLADTATGSLSANDGASYTPGTGVWTITGTVAQVNTALANLVFNPTVNNEVDTSISVNVDDGDEDGSGALTGTIDLNVTPVNDAPIATNLSSGTNYDASDSVVALNDIVISDVDSGETVTATLTLANVNAGSLSANNGATYNATTGVWTITGSVAQVNNALANLEFSPVANNTLDTTVAISIDDGDEDSSGPLLGAMSITVNPLPVVDPPVDPPVIESEPDDPVETPETEPPVETPDAEVVVELTKDNPLLVVGSGPVIPGVSNDPAPSLLAASVVEFVNPEARVDNSEVPRENSVAKPVGVDTLLIKLREQLEFFDDPI